MTSPELPEYVMRNAADASRKLHYESWVRQVCSKPGMKLPEGGWTAEGEAYRKRCAEYSKAQGTAREVLLNGEWANEPGDNETRYQEWREAVLTLTRLEDVNGGEAAIRATWNVLEGRAQRARSTPTPAEKGALSLYADGYSRGHEACAAERREAWARDSKRDPIAIPLAVGMGAGFALAWVLRLLGVL